MNIIFNWLENSYILRHLKLQKLALIFSTTLTITCRLNLKNYFYYCFHLNAISWQQWWLASCCVIIEEFQQETISDSIKSGSSSFNQIFCRMTLAYVLV